MPVLKKLALGTALLTSACLLSSCGSDNGMASSDTPNPTASPEPGGTPVPSPSSPLFCTQVYVYGVQIHVVDPGGNPIPSATATLQDGSYQETLKPITEDSSLGILHGAGERPGTYTLTVSAPGYKTQTIPNLHVTAGPCHVNPFQKEIVLQPADSMESSA